jgi:predicted DCC family thiol-disulfide oxidoreductase YuxK
MHICFHSSGSVVSEAGNFWRIFVAIVTSYIIVFDGVCNLCNSSVQFILKRDRKNQFQFASLQGHFGQQVLRAQQLKQDQFNSFILMEGNIVYTRSTAVLRVMKHLGGAWALGYGFIIIPKFLRDGLYNLIAKNRYKWFGRKEECWVPTPELQGKFLS